MGSIERHTRNGRTSYQVRWRDPAGKQKKRSFRRKLDADRFLTSVESAKLAGDSISRPEDIRHAPS